MVQGGFLEPTLDARYHRASMTQLPRPPTEALKRAFPDESLVAAWVPPAGLTSADSSDFRLAPRPQPAPQHLHATRRKIPKVSTERRVPKFDTQGESGSSGRRDYQSPPSDCSSAEAPPRGWSAAAPAAVAAVPEGEQPATCCAGQPSHVEPGTKQRPRSPRGSGTGSEEGWAPRPLAAPLARPRSTVAEGGSKLSDANGRAKASTGLHEINGNRPATSACERDEAEGNRQPRALLMESPPNDRFAGTAGPVAHGVSNASPSDDAEDPSVHPSPGDEREVAYEPAEHEIAATLNSLGDQSTKFANTKLVQELVDKYNKVSRRPALQVCTPEEFLEDYTLFHKVCSGVLLPFG